MNYFIQGDTVIIGGPKIKAIYKGKGIVKKWHIGNHYTVEHMATGKEIVLLPDEMETVYQHDIRLLQEHKTQGNSTFH